MLEYRATRYFTRGHDHLSRLFDSCGDHVLTAHVGKCHSFQAQWSFLVQKPIHEVGHPWFLSFICYFDRNIHNGLRRWIWLPFGVQALGPLQLHNLSSCHSKHLLEECFEQEKRLFVGQVCYSLNYWIWRSYRCRIIPLLWRQKRDTEPHRADIWG